jgi:BirA family biotin operon repressor/biotin-[acetyl-CoA-carboxylase] ligase
VTRFDPGRFEELLRARGLGLGAPLSVFDTIASTNDEAARAAAAGVPSGALFVAEAQTRGRGRRGQPWLSEASEALLFSLVLRPSLSAESASGLSLAFGLAVRDAVRPRVTAPVFVKWPNDVLVREKKLAGILVESQIRDAELGTLIVGIGLNVSARSFDGALGDTATSLALLGSTDLAREPLLVDLLTAIELRIGQFQCRGLSTLLEELRACDALLGRRVRVEARSGMAAGIDETGALLLRDDSGRLERVIAGSVETLA